MLDQEAVRAAAANHSFMTQVCVTLQPDTGVSACIISNPEATSIICRQPWAASSCAGTPVLWGFTREAAAVIRTSGCVLTHTVAAVGERCRDKPKGPFQRATPRGSSLAYSHTAASGSLDCDPRCSCTRASGSVEWAETAHIARAAVSGICFFSRSSLRNMVFLAQRGTLGSLHSAQGGCACHLSTLHSILSKVARCKIIQVGPDRHCFLSSQDRTREPPGSVGVCPCVTVKQ